MKSTLFGLVGILVLSTFVTTTPANFGLRIEDNTDRHDAELRLWQDLKLKYYNFTSIPPPHNKTSPITVNIGLDLMLISDLDARTQTLTTEMWLSLRWHDKRLRWDPTKYDNLTSLRVPHYQVWLPDIKLVNAAKMSKIDNKGYVNAVLFHNGSIWWIPPSTFYSACPIDLTYYPYDAHKCLLKFISWTMGGDDIDLRLNENSKLSLELAYNDGGEWEAIGSDGIYSQNFFPCCDQPFPDVTFSLTIRRRSPFYKFTILCPVISSVGIVLASFCLSAVSPIRITLDALALLFLVLELTHLSGKLPPVSSSPPIIFSFCGTAVVLVALTIIMTASIQSFLRSRVNVRPVPQLIKTFVVWRPIQYMFRLHGEGGSAFVPFKYSQEEEKLDATDAANPFDGETAASNTDNYDEWLAFFQVVDRIALCIFLFITLLVLILVSV